MQPADSRTCAAARWIHSPFIYICTQQESCRALVEAIPCEKNTIQSCSLREGAVCDSPGDSPCSVSANTLTSLLALCSCCTDQGGLNLTAWNSSIPGFTEPCSCNEAGGVGKDRLQLTPMCRFPALPLKPGSAPCSPLLHWNFHTQARKEKCFSLPLNIRKTSQKVSCPSSCGWLSASTGAPLGSSECFSKPVAVSLGQQAKLSFLDCCTLKNELRVAFWGALAGASLHCTQLLLFVFLSFVIFSFIKIF